MKNHIDRETLILQLAKIMDAWPEWFDEKLDKVLNSGVVYERKLLQWYKVNGKFERVIEMYTYDGYYKNLNSDQNSIKKYIISAPFIIREVEKAEKNVDDEGFSENGA